MVGTEEWTDEDRILSLINANSKDGLTFPTIGKSKSNEENIIINNNPLLSLQISPKMKLQELFKNNEAFAEAIDNDEKLWFTSRDDYKVITEDELMKNVVVTHNNESIDINNIKENNTNIDIISDSMTDDNDHDQDKDVSKTVTPSNKELQQQEQREQPLSTLLIEPQQPDLFQISSTEIIQPMMTTDQTNELQNLQNSESEPIIQSQPIQSPTQHSQLNNSMSSQLLRRNSLKGGLLMNSTTSTSINRVAPPMLLSGKSNSFFNVSSRKLSILKDDWNEQ